MRGSLSLITLLSMVGLVGLTLGVSGTMVPPLRPVCNTGALGPHQSGAADKFPEPVVVHAGGFVIFLSSHSLNGQANDQVVAIFPTNCSIAWTYSGAVLSGTNLETSGDVNGTIVAFIQPGPLANSVVVLNATTGLPTWTLNGTTATSIAVVQDYVLVVEGSATVLKGFHVATGALQWIKSGGTQLFVRRGYGSYALYANGTTVARVEAATGQVSWVTNMAPTLTTLSLPKDFAVDQQDIVVVNTVNQSSWSRTPILFGLNATSGTTLWTTVVTPHVDIVGGRPSIGPGRFYFIVAVNVRSFSLTTGADQWTLAQNGETVHGSPFAWKGFALVVYGLPTTMIALNPASGGPSWEVTAFNGSTQCCAGSTPVSIGNGRLALQGFGWNGGSGSVTVFETVPTAPSFTEKHCSGFNCAQGCETVSKPVGQCTNATVRFSSNTRIPGSFGLLGHALNSATTKTIANPAGVLERSINTECVGPSRLLIKYFQGSAACDTAALVQESHYDAGTCYPDAAGSHELIEC